MEPYYKVFHQYDCIHQNQNEQSPESLNNDKMKRMVLKCVTSLFSTQLLNDDESPSNKKEKTFSTLFWLILEQISIYAVRKFSSDGRNDGDNPLTTKLLMDFCKSTEGDRDSSGLAWKPYYWIQIVPGLDLHDVKEKSEILRPSLSSHNTPNSNRHQSGAGSLT